MNNQIIRASSRPIEPTSLDPSQLAKRLRLMIINGKNLSDNEALALAQYAVATQLNPFEGECFYLPGIGPGPGIAGYRRRASEQLWREAERSGIKGDTVYFWFEHQELTEDTPFFHPSKGDIGIKAILHDSLTKSRWEQRIIEHALKIQREGGLKFQEAYEIARDLVGPEPTWSAEAIVYADETFSFAGKHDRWNRVERAKKRAEKWALRKRFNFNLPEPENFDEDFHDVRIVEVKPEEQPKSEEELLSDLGFEPQKPQSQPQQRPYTPEALKNRIAQVAAEISGKNITDRERKILASVLNTTLNGDQVARHAVLKYLTGYESTKDIPAPMIAAMLKWLEVNDFNKPPSEIAIQEARGAYAQALIEQGQIELNIPQL